MDFSALSIAVQLTETICLIGSYEFICEPSSTFLNKIKYMRLLYLSCFDLDPRFKDDNRNPVRESSMLGLDTGRRATDVLTVIRCQRLATFLFLHNTDGVAGFQLPALMISR